MDLIINLKYILMKSMKSITMVINLHWDLTIEQIMKTTNHLEDIWEEVIHSIRKINS